MTKILFALLFAFQAHAFTDDAERVFGIGGTFYSGADKDTLAPGLGAHLVLAKNPKLNNWFDLINQFDLSVFFSGLDFAGAAGSYLGLSGHYEVGARLNLSQKGIIPYLDIGPMLGIMMVKLSRPPTAAGANQGSLKYGFAASIGCDWLVSGERGNGSGWGIQVKYFQLFKSPSMFEFPYASMGATGVLLQFRRILPEF